MVQCLQNPSLFHGVLFLLIGHAVHIDLLEHTQLVVAFVVDEVALAEGTLTQDLDLFEEADVHIFK